MISSNSLWSMPPKSLTAVSNEVHIWRYQLTLSQSHMNRLSGILTEDEKNRAERFHFDKDRQYFIVARGVMRIILSYYLQTEPEQLRFSYTQYGKPELFKEFSQGSLRFNLSHSHELALLAITRDREIGVDVEWIRPGLAEEQIIERFFSAREIQALRALPQDLQNEAFFNCWTRKEAYIKAKGEGLSMPLDQFDVTLVPGEQAAILETRGDPQEASYWSLREVFPGAGYAAAVAVQGQDWQLRCWQWGE